MIHLLVSALIAQSGLQVPDVVIGPDVGQGAVKVDAPVSFVTVFSDRAQVRRRAKVGIKAGTTVMQLPDLPGAVMLDTVRVSATGARVLRVEARPVERERYSIAQVEGMLDELEALDAKVSMVDAKRRAMNRSLGLIGSISPQPIVPEAQREGRPLLTIDPVQWFATLDFLGARRANARDHVRKLDAEFRELDKKRAELRASIQSKNLGAFSNEVIEVLVVVDAKGATKSAVEMEYFISGASWRPVYDLQYYARTGKLTIETAATVTQASGEDWSDIDLALSTAIPGRGIDFPELLTWTLGEKREFIPQPQRATNPPEQPRFAAPSPARTEWEKERELKVALLQERLRQLGTSIAMRSVEQSIQVDKRPQYGNKLAKRSRPRPPPAPPSVSMPSPVPMSEPSPGYAVSDDEGDSYAASESVSVTSRSAGRAQERFSRKPMSLFESVSNRGPQLTDRDLPAVAAGGFDYVYEAPTKANIESTGTWVRVPLAVETYPVTTFYEATPSLAKTAYLKSSVKNASGRPLLAGPVNIFVGNEFTGQGRLETTGAGGEIHFPLGADEDIRLVRNVVPQTETKGVFSKDDITTYRTEIEIGNYKKKTIAISIVDQIPKSAHEDVAVKLTSVTPQPKGPDKQGILRWVVTVPPGKTEKITFVYSITRPAGWQLRQH